MCSICRERALETQHRYSPPNTSESKSGTLACARFLTHRSAVCVCSPFRSHAFLVVRSFLVRSNKCVCVDLLVHTCMCVNACILFFAKISIFTYRNTLSKVHKTRRLKRSVSPKVFCSHAATSAPNNESPAGSAGVQPECVVHTTTTTHTPSKRVPSLSCATNERTSVDPLCLSLSGARSQSLFVVVHVCAWVRVCAENNTYTHTPTPHVDRQRNCLFHSPEELCCYCHDDTTATHSLTNRRRR